VTGGCDVAGAALERNAIAAMLRVVSRLIAPCSYHFVVAG